MTSDFVTFAACAARAASLNKPFFGLWEPMAQGALASAVTKSSVVWDFEDGTTQGFAKTSSSSCGAQPFQYRGDGDPTDYTVPAGGGKFLIKTARVLNDTSTTAYAQTCSYQDKTHAFNVQKGQTLVSWMYSGTTNAMQVYDCANDQLLLTYQSTRNCVTEENSCRVLMFGAFSRADTDAIAGKNVYLQFSDTGTAPLASLQLDNIVVNGITAAGSCAALQASALEKIAASAASPLSKCMLLDALPTAAEATVTHAGQCEAFDLAGRTIGGATRTLPGSASVAGWTPDAFPRMAVYAAADGNAERQACLAYTAAAGTVRTSAAHGKACQAAGCCYDSTASTLAASCFTSYGSEAEGAALDNITSVLSAYAPLQDLGGVGVGVPHTAFSIALTFARYVQPCTALQVAAMV
jgi:hypothetical protein